MIFLDLLSGNNFQTDDSQSTYLSFETNSFFQLNRSISFARNSAGALELKDNNDYYPFGMNHLKKGNSYFAAGSYKNYKFGGKELQEFGAYDFGARIYMADIGRWAGLDPYAERYIKTSPYQYGFNNPIFFTDPD